MVKKEKAQIAQSKNFKKELTDSKKSVKIKVSIGKVKGDRHDRKINLQRSFRTGN